VSFEYRCENAPIHECFLNFFLKENTQQIIAITQCPTSKRFGQDEF